MPLSRINGQKERDDRLLSILNRQSGGRIGANRAFLPNYVHIYDERLLVFIIPAQQLIVCTYHSFLLRPVYV